MAMAVWCHPIVDHLRTHARMHVRMCGSGDGSGHSEALEMIELLRRNKGKFEVIPHHFRSIMVRALRLRLRLRTCVVLWLSLSTNVGAIPLQRTSHRTGCPCS